MLVWQVQDDAGDGSITKTLTLSHWLGAGLGGHGGNALHAELAGGDVEVDGGSKDAGGSEDGEGRLHILNQPGPVLGGSQCWPLLYSGRPVAAGAEDGGQGGEVVMC